MLMILSFSNNGRFGYSLPILMACVSFSVTAAWARIFGRCWIAAGEGAALSLTPVSASAVLS